MAEYKHIMGSKGLRPLVGVGAKPQMLIVILFCLLLTACATTKQTQSPQVFDVTRTRSWLIDQSVQNISDGDNQRVVFIPKGAYIVAPSQEYQVGTWVRLIPGADWPADEPAPTLLIGRIVERTNAQARLEILALNPGFRDPRLISQAYSGDVSKTMHAITKRLVFGDGPVSDGASQIHVAPGRTDGMEGNEIYAAIDLNRRDSGRLASHISALLTVGEIASDGTLLKVADGTVKSSSAFVLLDAPVEPDFDVQIEVQLKGGLRSDVVNEISKLTASGLPGMNHIRVKYVDSGVSPDALMQELGGTQTETLSVVLLDGTNGAEMLSQSNRVMDSPWQMCIDNNDKEMLALAAVLHSLDMLGYYGVSAYLAEKYYDAAIDLSKRAAIAPALANAYNALERGDWGLELALELAGYADKLKGKDKTHLLAASVAVADISGLSDEFASQFDAVKKNQNDLNINWLKVLAFASLIHHDDEAFGNIYKKLQKAGIWHEPDEMFACMMRISDRDDACDNGYDHAQSKFARLWYRAEMLIHENASDDLMELALSLDEVGAPWTAHKIWVMIARSGLSNEAMDTAWMNAASYARKSQRLRPFLNMMSELARFLSQHPQKLDQTEFVHAISGWRALDWRIQLAALCVSRAMGAPAGEARELLNYAAELYISTGDAENAAIVFNLLSKNFEAEPDKAAAYRSKAKAFAKGSYHPAVSDIWEDTTP